MNAGVRSIHALNMVSAPLKRRYQSQSKFVIQNLAMLHHPGPQSSVILQHIYSTECGRVATSDNDENEKD